MLIKPFSRIWLAGLVLGLVLLACSSIQSVPSTAVATGTQLLPTLTAVPTSTFEPSANPDVAMTQAYKDFYSEVKEYNDKGYFTSMEGSQTLLDDFSESWPQIGW